MKYDFYELYESFSTKSSDDFRKISDMNAMFLSLSLLIRNNGYFESLEIMTSSNH